MAAPGDFQWGGSQGVLAPVAFDPSALAGAPDPAVEQGARVGEVRFDDPLHAQQAVQQLDGSTIHGWKIKVSFHGMNNPTGTKLLITNCPPTCMWMDLKDHFKHLGNVAFAGMVGDKGKGKGKGENSYAVQQQQQGMALSQQLQAMPAQPSAGSGYVLPVDGAPAAKRPRTDQFGNVIPDGPPGTTTGEVRYAEAEAAAQASVVLSGTELGGRPITVELDPQDRTKLLVSGIPDGLGWMDLKGHFASMGTVVFADIRPAAGLAPQAQLVQAPPAPVPPSGCAQVAQSPLQALQELAQLPPQAAAQPPLQAGPPAAPQAVGALPVPPPPPPPPVAVAVASAGGAATATVRYETSEEAQQAVSTLNQLDLKDFGGGTLTVVADASARDGTKIRMTGLPAHIEWQDVKDFCSQIGKIAFCEVIKPPAPLQQLDQLAQQLAQQPVQIMGQQAVQLIGGFPQQPVLVQHMVGCAALDSGCGLLPEGDDGKGKGKGKRRRPPQYGADGKLCGEVRYESPEHAQQAIATLHGSILCGEQIKVLKHGMNNPLGTKLLICGISPATTWRELKEHFLPIGPIAYANC